MILRRSHEAKKHSKAAGDANQGLAVQHTNLLTNGGGRNRHDFVDHDLGSRCQSVPLRWVDGNPQQRRVDQLSGQQTHGNATQRRE